MEYADSFDDCPFFSFNPGYDIVNNIVLKRGMKILDFGCGTGFPSVQIAGMLGKNGGKVFGLDIWEEGICRSSKKSNGLKVRNCDFKKGNENNIEEYYGNEFFDCVVSNNGIQHPKNLGNLLLLISKSLKLHGQFIFTVISNKVLMNFYDALKKVIVEKFDKPDFLERIDDHIKEKRPSLEFVEELLIQKGFRISSKLKNSFFMKFLDTEAFLDYHVIREWFSYTWKALLKDFEYQEVIEEVMKILEEEEVKKNGFIRIDFPYYLVDCRKK